ncbi:MAG: ABC transporter ATP-binding protein [Gammaproteobacteria bacterium]|nr:ABC transporter ATP-binding protein [Gammaproteobacteria bacterium]
MSALLETEDLEIAVPSRVLVRHLSLTIQPGALIAMLGPNGVGKTLSLHTLAGLRPAGAGAVRVRGADVRLLGQRERALRVGLLLQEQDDPFPTTVLETALMGRHARLGIWQWETGEDHAVAMSALAQMDLAGTESRAAGTLSGGERRRLGIATLLVQDPDLLLLDEPLNHLDPGHQFAVVAVLRRLAAEGKTVIASLHDPALAVRDFHSALLLHGDGRWQFGPTAQLLDGATLSDLYGVPFQPYHGDNGTVMLPTPSYPQTTTAGNVTPLRRPSPSGRKAR